MCSPAAAERAHGRGEREGFVGRPGCVRTLHPDWLFDETTVVYCLLSSCGVQYVKEKKTLRQPITQT